MWSETPPPGYISEDGEASDQQMNQSMDTGKHCRATCCSGSDGKRRTNGTDLLPPSQTSKQRRSLLNEFLLLKVRGSEMMTSCLCFRFSSRAIPQHPVSCQSQHG